MKEQLSETQFVFLLIWTVMASGVIFLPYMISHFTSRDSWISALLFATATLLLTGIAWLYVRTCSSQTLMQSLLGAFGPWLGRIFGAWLLLFLFISASMYVRKTTLFVEETVLARTPLYIIDLLVVIPLAYATYLGLEVIGRLVELVTPVAVLVTGILSLLALKNVHPAMLLPILADGWSPVLRGAVLPWRFALESLLCLQFVTSLKKPRKSLPRALLWTGLVLTFFGVLAQVLIVATLGDQLTYSKYPILEVVKAVRYGEFFQRLDPLYVMGVLMLLMLKISIFLYVFAHGLKEILKLNHYRDVIWSASLAIWGASMMLWRDGETLDQYIVYTTPGYYAATILLIPLLAIGGNWLRGKISPGFANKQAP